MIHTPLEFPLSLYLSVNILIPPSPSVSIPLPHTGCYCLSHSHTALYSPPLSQTHTGWCCLSPSIPPHLNMISLILDTWLHWQLVKQQHQCVFSNSWIKTAEVYKENKLVFKKISFDTGINIEVHQGEHNCFYKPVHTSFVYYHKILELRRIRK